MFFLVILFPVARFCPVALLLKTTHFFINSDIMAVAHIHLVADENAGLLIVPLLIVLQYGRSYCSHKS